MSGNMIYDFYFANYLSRPPPLFSIVRPLFTPINWIENSFIFAFYHKLSKLYGNGKWGERSENIKISSALIIRAVCEFNSIPAWIEKKTKEINFMIIFLCCSLPPKSSRRKLFSLLLFFFLLAECRGHRRWPELSCAESKKLSLRFVPSD